MASYRSRVSGAKPPCSGTDSERCKFRGLVSLSLFETRWAMLADILARLFGVAFRLG
jgi:hypothetical protein